MPRYEIRIADDAEAAGYPNDYPFRRAAEQAAAELARQYRTAPNDQYDHAFVVRGNARTGFEVRMIIDEDELSLPDACRDPFMITVEEIEP